MIKVEKGGEDNRNLYEIRHAAAENSIMEKRIVFENNDFIITAGDYNGLMAKVAENLGKASNFTANDNEKSMLECYVKSFKEGSLGNNFDYIITKSILKMT